MTMQTTFDATGRRNLSEQLAATPLDPAKGRAREFRVIYALTLMVLVMVFAAARLVRRDPRKGRSIVQEARSATAAALAYAYRH
jgi:lipopolysaccharide export LptBFGC system permease protein LptF